MNRSLSVLLPVHNVQSSLATKVDEILEVLPELTARFELLIADDGSTDGTWEVACELARRYPQVRLLREPIRRGPIHAVRQSALAAKGDAVIAHDGQPGIDVRAISRLWRSIAAAGNRELDDGFRFLKPRAIEELRRSVATTKELVKNDAPSAGRNARSETTSVDPADRKTPRPNFLSRVKTRVRDFTTGE